MSIEAIMAQAGNYDVVVISNGVGGYTAAIRAGQLVRLPMPLQ
ncbi:MAG: hypothetical protein WAL59_24225 [Roseiarcus sp.]